MTTELTDIVAEMRAGDYEVSRGQVNAWADRIEASMQEREGWRPINEYARDDYFGGYVLTWKHGFTPIVARRDTDGWWTPYGRFLPSPEYFIPLAAAPTGGSET